MRLTASPDIAARIASRLPPGRSVDDLRLVECTATIEASPLSTVDAALQARIASEVEAAGGPPMLSNGLPTILRVVAWMAHEGRNLNGLRFLADDLGPAADRIREPNYLPMDWNHSAVFPWSFDPKVIGMWYRAEKRWDPKAQDGKGAYGILMQGIMWSWVFPEQANAMLAEQERHGKLDFSMACLPERSELVIENGTVVEEIAHNPTFMTLSALDVPPADPDAIGVGEEGSDDPTLETQLTTKLTALAAVAAVHAPVGQSEEESMTPEEIAELNRQLADLRAQLTQQLTLQSTAAADLAAATARVTELEGELTEAQTAREALVTASTEATAAAEAQLTTLQEELAAAQARVAEYEAAEVAAAAETRYTARLASMPETYRAALERRTPEQQQSFRERWSEASDEAWETFRADALLGMPNVQVSYRLLSEQEGGTVTTAAAADTDASGARPIRSILAEVRGTPTDE